MLQFFIFSSTLRLYSSSCGLLIQFCLCVVFSLVCSLQICLDEAQIVESANTKVCLPPSCTGRRVYDVLCVVCVYHRQQR